MPLSKDTKQTPSVGNGRKIAFLLIIAGIVASIATVAGLLLTTDTQPSAPAVEIGTKATDYLKMPTPAVTTPSGTATSSNSEGMNANMVFAENQVMRGNSQAMTVMVFDSGGKMLSGANVDGVITRASGTTISFSGSTNTNGQFIYSWGIGGGADEGVYTVKITISHSGYQSIERTGSFEVIQGA